MNSAIFKNELERIDAFGTSKRQEKIIEGYDHTGVSPRALISGKKYLVFNSNDYLGLRFDPRLSIAETKASHLYGLGPGAVRFISGTLKVHSDLEIALAKLHKREAAMLFSSAFAANLAVIACMAKGQSKGTMISDKTLLVSDELNHRSIVDGVRLSGLPSGQRLVFKHMDMTDLRNILQNNAQNYERIMIVTDGIFSMLGEYQDLKTMRAVADDFSAIFIVDDSHGIGAFGATGLGTEEVCNTQADLLVGTLGKALGTDGGYVVGDKVIIDYLRESAATYIYSNPITAGTAAAALESLKILETEGIRLLANLNTLTKRFISLAYKAGLKLASESIHPIQPVLVGDPIKAKALTQKLFDQGILVTNISYPVVAPTRDEIRIQINANHTDNDLETLVKALLTLS